MTSAHLPVGRLGATSIDCPDPAELADFYAALLGMRRVVETPDGGVVAITDGAAILAMMRVDPYVAPTWPAGARPQQMHLDVSVDDLDRAVAAAEALGARQAPEQAQPALWRVMLDPAGHPFCLTTVGTA
ncbi:glyoxalase/bleomycin resistance/dioxygenase family protein [Mycolicibacterium chubuense]|uniref:VOC family protein n=1 Tax=Mycolicibacterium chubuense TaxID=1800 RepID=UPI000652A6DD|nr:VOC family protein [Mycolicibacterium chubuense]ORA49371.1 glyoxalase/bleomycin resistance/dioxygenase family protein [Mycolicibacterium chubuense]